VMVLVLGACISTHVDLSAKSPDPSEETLGASVSTRLDASSQACESTDTKAELEIARRTIATLGKAQEETRESNLALAACLEEAQKREEAANIKAGELELQLATPAKAADGGSSFLSNLFKKEESATMTDGELEPQLATPTTTTEEGSNFLSNLFSPRVAPTQVADGASSLPLFSSPLFARTTQDSPAISVQEEVRL